MNVEVDKECLGEEMTINVTDKSKDAEPVREVKVIVYYLGKLMAEEEADKEGIVKYTPQLEGEYRIIARKSPKYCSETEEVNVIVCESHDDDGSGSGISETETSTSTITEVTSTSVTWTTSTTTSTSTSSSSTTLESTTTVPPVTTTLVEKEDDSPGFIGRFLYNVGKASLIGALIIISLMTANSLRKRGGEGGESLWAERPKTKLQSI